MNTATRLLLTRLVLGVFVLWAAFSLAFLILHALPGDPVSILLSAAGGTDAGPEEVQALSARYGLDRPLPEQYLRALLGLLHGDLGLSYVSGRPVTEAVLQALPSTLALSASTLLISLVLGVGTALAAVGSRRRVIRDVLTALPGLGISLPTFWVGLVLLQIFSFRLGWIPALGAEGLSGLVLPVTTLAIPIGATVAQVVHRSLEAAWDQQYITTYRAAGETRTRLLLSHALRASTAPLLSIGGLVTGQVLGGSVVVETVFTRNGLGRLAQTSVEAQDIPVVLGVVVFTALVFVLINFVTDLLQPWADPRTRTRGARS